MIWYKIIDKNDEKHEKIVNIKQLSEITGYSIHWLRKKLWIGGKIGDFDVFQAKITFILQRKSKYTYYQWKSMVKANSKAELVDLSGRSDRWFKNYHNKLISEEGFTSKSKETAWRLVEKIEWEKI